MSEGRGAIRAEATLIGVSVAALASVLLANVIRVYGSPETALVSRTVLFAAGWLAAIGWGVAAGRKTVLVWLGVLAACGVLIAICQHFAGGVSAASIQQLIGPAGAGLGCARLLQRMLDGKHAVQAAGIAMLLGSVAALWLSLEPTLELWKFLPNDWELSKNLEYRWGIRMGQERARFLFDTPMEAGVAQWFLGTVCLAVAMTRISSATRRGLLAAAALLLFASVALTYSRAGLVLGALSIASAGLMAIERRREALLVCVAACLFLLGAGFVARWALGEESPGVRNVASILDPFEEANRIRLSQLATAGEALSGTPWHGNGPSTFVTLAEAPRMPEHESSPVGLVASFGIGGGALVLVFAWHVIRSRRVVLGPLVGGSDGGSTGSSRIAMLGMVPFAVYSLVAPILAGLMFGMICFIIMGLLALTQSAKNQDSGKP